MCVGGGWVVIVVCAWEGSDSSVCVGGVGSDSSVCVGGVGSDSSVCVGGYWGVVQLII